MFIVWNVLLLSITVFVVSKAMPTIHIKSFWTAIIVAVIYSVINFLAGWLLMLISLPFMIITFGLFKFVINAFLLWITDIIIEDFEIETPGSTLIAAFFITIIDSVLRWVF